MGAYIFDVAVRRCYMSLVRARGRKSCHRKGISILELFQMFPDDRIARDWLVEQRWGKEGRTCPHCGGCHTAQNKNNRFWCPDCRNRFSVKTGTATEVSKIPMQKVIAIYLWATSLKSVDSWTPVLTLERKGILCSKGHEGYRRSHSVKIIPNRLFR